MESLYVKELLHTITKALARGRNGRAIRRQERKMQRGINESFKKQGDYIVKEYAKLANKKAWGVKNVNDDVDDIFEAMDDTELVSGILDVSATSMEYGGKTRVRKSKLKEIGIDFNLSNPEAERYLLTDRPLVLAKLADTTKEHIKPILMDSVIEGRAPQETAKIIRENFALSKARSLMISVNEVGHAYEWGNYVPMNDAKKRGYKVSKSWLTVNDAKVTPAHTQNQEDGWIELDDTFSGTGDELAPASDNPNCRCTILYDII